MRIKHHHAIIPDAPTFGYEYKYPMIVCFTSNSTENCVFPSTETVSPHLKKKTGQKKFDEGNEWAVNFQEDSQSEDKANGRGGKEKKKGRGREKEPLRRELREKWETEGKVDKKS